MSGPVTAEMRARARAKLLATELAPDDPRHGRWTTYVNYGCRCDRCREAWRIRNKVHRERAANRARRERMFGGLT